MNTQISNLYLAREHEDQGARLKDNSLEQELREIASGISKLVARGFANVKLSIAKSDQDFDLSLAVMASLEKGPKNGFGITREISLLSGGTQSPKQAEVEAEIQTLLTARFAKVSIKDDVRLYELTKSGKVALDSKEQSLKAQSQETGASKKVDPKQWINWASPELLEAGKSLAHTIAGGVAIQSEEIQAEVTKVLKQANSRIQEHLAKKN